MPVVGSVKLGDRERPPRAAGALEQRPECMKGLSQGRSGEEHPGRASSGCQGHEVSTCGHEEGRADEREKGGGET